MPRPADALPAPEVADQRTDSAVETIREAAVPGDAEAVGLLTGQAEVVKVLGEKDPDALAIDPRQARSGTTTDNAGLAAQEEVRGPADADNDQGGDYPGGRDPQDAGGEDDGPITARGLGLIGNDPPAPERARLAAARAEAIRLGEIALRLEDRARAAERGQ